MSESPAASAMDGSAGDGPVLGHDALAELVHPDQAFAYADHLGGDAAGQVASAHAMADDGGAIPNGDFAVLDASPDMGDLHAALVSLASESLSSLDLALEHLTTSADLFDVPAIDYGDMDQH